MQMLHMKGERGRRQAEALGDEPADKPSGPRLDEHAVDRQSRLVRQRPEGGYSVQLLHISKLMEIYGPRQAGRARAKGVVFASSTDRPA